MTPRRLTYTIDNADQPDPRVGDVLKSVRSFYLVVDARKVKTRDGARRFALGVLRFDEMPETYGEARLFGLRWFPRRRKRKA